MRQPNVVCAPETVRRCKCAWARDYRVRLLAGGAVIFSAAAASIIHPAFQAVTAAVGVGLVVSAVRACGAR